MSELDDRYSPSAHRERLTRENEELRCTIDDLTVQCKFWRQAAEHAVKGWNALEDRVAAGLDALDAIEGNVNAVRELLGSADEWAPVEPLENALRELPAVDLGDGVPLRVAEDETPK